jgi:hypothetical protein
MEKGFTQLLLGSDLRQLKNSGTVFEAVHDQESFDELFSLIFHHERPLVMRAADAVEKITAKKPEFLRPHKLQLLSVLKSADHKELKWHVAQLLPRIELDSEELEYVWHMLTYWALNKNESKIVRVNSLQGLFELKILHADLSDSFEKTMESMEHEMVPSIQARIKKLKKSASIIAQTRKSDH